MKIDWFYVWRSPRPEQNCAIFRLENGELVEVGFYRKRPYNKKFLDFEFLGKAVFVSAI